MISLKGDPYSSSRSQVCVENKEGWHILDDIHWRSCCDAVQTQVVHNQGFTGVFFNRANARRRTSFFLSFFFGSIAQLVYVRKNSFDTRIEFPSLSLFPETKGSIQATFFGRARFREFFSLSFYLFRSIVRVVLILLCPIPWEH